MGMKPEWAPTPPVPRELFEMVDRSREDMYRIAGQTEVPDNIEAAKARIAEIERAATRRADFFANLAEWHSRLMRHCLYLVQRHYSDPRLLKIKGRFGVENISDFRGSQLRSQVDVRVFPGSIEPRTKAAIEAKVLAFADRGWIPPQAAMAAINGGTAEELINDYEQDVARAHRVIQKIKLGPDAFLGQPFVVGPDGMEGVPNWMPRRFDNIEVQLSVFESWMKTSEHDLSSSEIQAAANLYYEALLFLQAQKAQEAMMAQAAEAESLGMSNAARPQGEKPMPSQPNPDGSSVN